MTSAMSSTTAHSRSAGAAIGRADSICPDLSLESRAGCRQGITGDVLVYVDGLGMLTKIIQA